MLPYKRPRGVEAMKAIKCYVGIPVELVQEEAQKAGIALSIPDNIYDLIKKADEQGPEKAKVNVTGLPHTEILYYDPKNLKFTGAVVATLPALSRTTAVSE